MKKNIGGTDRIVRIVLAVLLTVGAWMTGFGNARLAGRGAVELADLPEGAARRSPIGFMQ